MTPGEWLDAWETFMREDQPLFCSEHRDSFNETEETEDEIYEDADINIFGISKARQNLSEARRILNEQGIKANVFHIAWLKPFNAEKYIGALKKTPLGLVTDAGRVICGAPEHVAYELMHAVPGSLIYANGIDDLPKSKNPKRYNAVPDAQRIADKALSIIKKQRGIT